MLAAGYVKDKNRNFLFDVGVNADLGMITPGLSFKSAFSVDYYDYYSEGYKEDYAVYEPVWANMNGKDMIIDLKQYGKDSRSANEYVGSSTYYQTMSFRAQFDYNRTFAKLHNVGATLMGWGYQRQNSNDSSHSGSSYHRTTNVNAGLRATYNFNHLYYAEFDGAHRPLCQAGSRATAMLSPRVCTLRLALRSRSSWFKQCAALCR
jgi:hypothetical protein